MVELFCWKKLSTDFSIILLVLLMILNYLCTKTSDNESNSQQNAEIDTVAKSLPHFGSFSRISYV